MCRSGYAADAAAACGRSVLIAMDPRALLERFVQLYPDFRERLRRRLGSVDLADEALNEVYVKLRASGKSYSVRNVGAYLFRLALNAATDQRRARDRQSLADRIEAALEIPDPAPGAARIAEEREELRRLEEAIARLPERRRKILIAARMHERSCRDIARELGLSTRTVEIELRRALDHCAEWLDTGRKEDFANVPRRTSLH